MTPEALALLLQFGALAVLLAFSAFFSSSETALLSLTRAQATRMAKGTMAERRVTDLLHSPQRILSTIVVGNMIVNVMIASLIARASRSLWGDSGVAIAIGVSIVLLLLFGEVTPKTIAVRHADRVARLVAIPLDIMCWVVTPLRVLLRGAADMVLFVLGQPRMSGWGLVSREEITALLALGEAEGVTTERERALIDNILTLTTLEAHDIMVPRTEVIGLRDTMTMSEAYAVACSQRHSRLLVYDEDLDDCWGIFCIVDMPPEPSDEFASTPLRDVRRETVTQERLSGFPLYPVQVFPESARVEGLLHQMRCGGAWMVVLVDEYGGTAGILTLDDILAEIVGKISPADTPTGPTPFDVHGMDVAGSTHLHDADRLLGCELPQNGSDTLSGYVTERLGRLARAGDVIEDDGFRFRVIKMAGRRIGTLHIEPIGRDAGGDA